MRIPTTVITLIVLLPCIAQSQSNGKISGKITDDKNKEPLQGATVSVLNEKSGIFIKHDVSNKSGEFSIPGLPLNISLIVIVSFTGYRDTSAVYELTTSEKNVNTGQWKLKEGSDDLDSIIVTARKPPFVIKKDTIEFNASAFKSLPNDMVQDLLRKLPGLQIDDMGNITINGRKVNKIKVDGRDFFSNNIKVATENLPGAIIDKVQVYESIEKTDRFKSVIQPVNKDLTINLKLKKENNRGIFGKVDAGYGTSDRYHAGTFINSFKGDKRMSLIGNIGNLPGGEFRDIMQGMDIGINKRTIGGGVNINNRLGKKGTLDANYTLNNYADRSISSTDRTNLLPDSSFLYNSNATTNTDNQLHNLALNYRADIDTLRFLEIRPTIEFTNNASDVLTSAASKTTAGELINSQDINNISREKSFSIGNKISYMQTSANSKNVYSFAWEMKYSQGAGIDNNISNNVFYGNGATSNKLDQYGNTDNNGLSNNLSVSIYRTFSKRFVGIIGYVFSQNNNIYDKDVFNYNNVSEKHDILDSTYSIHNKNTGISHQPSASIGYINDKLSVELGIGMRFGYQKNAIVWKDSVITINQQNLVPRLSFAYQLSKNSNLSATYMATTTQPTSEQLAPVQNNNNPFYIKLGNPFLKTAITHQLSTNLLFFSSDHKWNLALVASGSMTGNQIVDDSYYDAEARQIGTYRNVNGVYNININLTLGKSVIMHDWNLLFNVSPGINYANQVGFVNREKNDSRTMALSPSAIVAVGYSTKLSMIMMASMNNNVTNYSLNGINDIDYRTNNATLSIKWAPVKRVAFKSSVIYIYNSQLPADFQRSKTILNGGVNYNFLKSEKLEIGIAVNDILNQNISVTRTVSSTAIENRQVNALRRYGMLTAAYRIGSFKAPTPHF